MPTTFDTTSRPGYMFNQLEQKWYPIAGLVATDYNYTWIGTNSYNNTVNFLDNVIAKSKFNCFLNPTARLSAIPSPQIGLITFIQQSDVGATLNLFQYWNGSIWIDINKTDIFYQSSAPSSASTGNLWINSTTLEIFVYTGSIWVQTSGGSSFDPFFLIGV